eukprot:8825535-Pyramimonas_sp.AAC.1
MSVGGNVLNTRPMGCRSKGMCPACGQWDVGRRELHCIASRRVASRRSEARVEGSEARREASNRTLLRNALLAPSHAGAIAHSEPSDHLFDGVGRGEAQREAASATLRTANGERLHPTPPDAPPVSCLDIWIAIIRGIIRGIV